jgi:hypothetical protein
MSYCIIREPMQNVRKIPYFKNKFKFHKNTRIILLTVFSLMTILVQPLKNHSKKKNLTFSMLKYKTNSRFPYPKIRFATNTHNNFNEKCLNGDVVRVDARTLTKTEFQANFELSRPVVLSNVFDIDHESWTENLLERLGEKEIQFDIRKSVDSSVDTYEATLTDYISSILEESTHEESWYFMNEDILAEDKLLNKKFSLPERLFGFDLFNYFPEEIRPKTALIVGGTGSRSFLHVDPYEWTGWNYLLEGEKLCNFQLLIFLDK